MKKWILSLVLASVAAVAWALPSVQDVEAEVRQGRYVQAESMMREVVTARQSSAKAHYIYAEILAHNGKIALAAEEAQKARLLDPDLKFTNDPEKFRSFEAALVQKQRPAARDAQGSGRTQAAAPARTAPAAATAGMPSWIWLAGIAVIGFFLWRRFSRNRAAAAAAAGYGAPGAALGGGVGPQGPYTPGAAGYPPPGYAPPGYAPQRSGMLGTGLAAAGGVAAGMLAGEMLRNRSAENSADAGTSLQPGAFDSPDAGALENRPIDFGSGGDWDAGASDAGGGGDGGGWD